MKSKRYAYTRKPYETHGLTNHVLYRMWYGMKERCNNPKNERFKDYGGRGIKICPEWNQSFSTFLADMGERPTAIHTIDRRDNNGNYEPSNCYWATREQQVANKRQDHRSYTAFGIRESLEKHAARFGLSKPSLLRRMRRTDGDIEKALQLPRQTGRHAPKDPTPLKPLY